MRSYFASGLDALVIDKFILSKAPIPNSNGVRVGNRGTVVA
jgi:hypothetical protein